MDLTKIIPESTQTYSIDIVSIDLNRRIAKVKINIENSYIVADMELDVILDESTSTQRNVLKAFFKEVIAAAADNVSSNVENDII